MVVYAILFMLPYVLLPLRRRNRTLYVFALAGLWALAAGIRLDVGGTDYFSYRDFYLRLKGVPFSFTGHWEPLFTSLAGLCKKAGMDFHWFFGFVALLGILPAVHVVDKRTEGSPLALLVYGIETMFYGSFVILRQHVAMGLGFLALDAAMERKRLGPLVLAVVAAGFHYSALVLLALPLTALRLRPRARTLLWLVLGGLGFGLFALVALGAAGTITNKLTVRLVHYVLTSTMKLNPLNVLELAGIAWFLRARLRNPPPVLENSFLILVAFALFANVEAIFVRFGMYFEYATAILLALAAGKGAYIPKAGMAPLGEGAYADGPIASRLRLLLSKSVIEAAIVAYYLAKITRWLIVNGGGTGGFIPYRSVWG